MLELGAAWTEGWIAKWFERYIQEVLHTVVAEMITEFIRFEPEICICNGNINWNSRENLYL